MLGSIEPVLLKEMKARYVQVMDQSIEHIELWRPVSDGLTNTEAGGSPRNVIVREMYTAISAPAIQSNQVRHFREDGNEQ